MTATPVTSITRNASMASMSVTLRSVFTLRSSGVNSVPWKKPTEPMPGVNSRRFDVNTKRNIVVRYGKNVRASSRLSSVSAM